MILKDRTAIVTGAGSGIGRAAALIIAGEGAIVGVADRNAEGAQATVEQIRAAGGRAKALVFDLTDDKALEASFHDFIRRGRPDRHPPQPCRRAGRGDVLGVSVKGFDTSWTLNVRAHFLGARIVMPFMKEAGRGVILNTSSSSGVLYDREMIAYTTTKHAVIAMTRQMAGDYGRFGIRVNALCPGWVDTPVQRAVHRADGRARSRRSLCPRKGAARPLGKRRGDRGGGAVPGLRPVILHDRPDPGCRWRRDGGLDRPAPRAGLWLKLDSGGSPGNGQG